MGKALCIVVTVFIIYGFTGQYWPSFLRHPGLTFKNFINLIYLTTDGIFGSPLYTSSLYIVLFVALGALMEVSGIGDYITDLATAGFGKYRGGPAKVAVIASGLFGSISGSAVANVIGTGTFTIPLMKRTGYDPETAAAIEASASTGGQFTPPVMGATAFLIAERLGLPYFELVKAAAIPAILYYLSLLFSVDVYAQKNGLLGLPREEIPKVKPLLKKLYLLAPLVFLVVILSVLGKTVARAGLYTILVAPALTTMGFSPLASHMFIFYFGCISVITPPVALASYAGAGIAGCSPTKAGTRAFRLAICAFILPYLFCYNETLLFQGAWYAILWSMLSALVGVYCLACGQEGFLYNWKIAMWERVLLVAGAFALVVPGIITDLIGFAVLIALFALHKLIRREPAYIAPKRSTAAE